MLNKYLAKINVLAQGRGAVTPVKLVGLGLGPLDPKSNTLPLSQAINIVLYTLYAELTYLYL